jgi:hypothetical protein
MDKYILGLFINMIQWHMLYDIKWQNGMCMNDELQRICKEAAMTYFRVLFFYLEGLWKTVKTLSVSGP